MLSANRQGVRGVMVVVKAEQLFRIQARLIPIMTAALTLSLVAGLISSLSAQTALTLVSPASVVHEYVSAAAAIPEHAAIPPNLEVSSVYRALLADMLRQSPTFRRQLLRIAGAQHLTIRLQWVPSSWLGGVRAKTQFTTESNGRLSANIDIAKRERDIELIAHEIEHVIEQLDHVDLRTKAGQPDSGVHAFDGPGVYETNRAIRVGVQVAQEVR
jgi:hypothetical protein